MYPHPRCTSTGQPGGGAGAETRLCYCTTHASTGTQLQRYGPEVCRQTGIPRWDRAMLAQMGRGFQEPDYGTYFRVPRREHIMGRIPGQEGMSCGPRGANQEGDNPCLPSGAGVSQRKDI
jgi:hypothetical protein